jgi:hypothetical protein
MGRDKQPAAKGEFDIARLICSLADNLIRTSASAAAVAAATAATVDDAAA